MVYKSAKDHPSGQALMKIDTLHPMYDPLMYVLMFLFGDKGLSIDSHPLTRKKNLNAVLLCSIINTGPCLKEEKLLILYTGWADCSTSMLLTCMEKIEFSRLQYLRSNQSQLRADLY